MFKTVDVVKINPRKSREQVQAQLERILALFPRKLNKRRQQRVEWLSRNRIFLTNLMVLRDQMGFSEESVKEAHKIWELYFSLGRKEEKARTKATIKGYESLTGIFAKILKKF